MPRKPEQKPDQNLEPKPGQNLELAVSVPQGWRLEVAYKQVRHIWFRADARRKRFSISAPEQISRQDLARAIAGKSAWMAKRAACPAIPRLIPLTTDHGDTCLFRGKPYEISIVDGPGQAGVTFHPETGIQIRVRKGTGGAGAALVLSAWLCQELGQDLSALLARWQPILGVWADQCKIRKMRTRWGSCNTRVKRIWINTALICLPPDLLAYVLVHELLHLKEPSHNQRFYSLMARVLPDWQEKKARLTYFAPGLG